MIELLIYSVICGILGRLGGKKGFNTKFRDIGCSLILCLATWRIGLVSGYFWGYIALIPCFLAQMGSLTTYRYFLPKPEDYKWWHYSLHTFMICLSLIFLILVTKQWIAFGVRCLVSAGLVGLWSQLVSWDDLEEWGRYFLICFSLGLFLIK